MEQQLYDLLRQCTVRISVLGKAGHGTGLFVAPGLLLTCAHVVKDGQPSDHAVAVYWNGQSHPARIMKCLLDLDLALLHVDLTGHPCVLLNEEAIPFDTLYGYGYPDDYSSGDPATFTLEGKAGEQGEQLKFKTGQVRPGLSGAPILNTRTGRVCGVIQLTRDRTSDLGGRAIPITIIFRAFPEIVALQKQFHFQDRRWANCLRERVALTAGALSRQRMLERVRGIWITGFLEKSLHRATLITLGLHEQPDVVMNPWRPVLQEMNRLAHPLLPGTRIIQAYDDMGGDLLILGEPGSGKTTLLLELADDLLDRASSDDTHPIPVVFNLSSWVAKRQPIEEWLVEEMNTKYQVPRKLGRSWIDTDQILPLLDGLDEVSPAHRTACVVAINAYRQNLMVPVVVCSRSAEYLNLTTALQLRSAVVIEPLTTQQIDDHLLSVGEQLASLRTALHNDSMLLALAATPIMLSVLVLAYEGKAIEDLPTASSLETQRQQVFAIYIKRMLQRRRAETRYTPQQTMHWLAWLAQQMVQHDQTEFYIEHMQPDWLSEGQLHRIYEHLAVRIPDTLIGGIISLLIITMLFSTVFSPPFALCYGILGGLVGGLIGRGNRIRPSAEPDVPPGRSLWHNIIDVRYLRNGLIVGLSFGLVYGWSRGLNFGLAYGLSFGLMSDLLSAILERRISARPLAKMTWSWRNLWYELINFGYLGTGLSAGLSYALAYTVSTELANQLHSPQSNVEAYALVYVLNYTIVGILLCIILGRREPSVHPAEVIIWSWRSFWRSLINIRHFGNAVLFGTLVGLLIGLSAVLRIKLSVGLSFGFNAWLIFGLSYWLLLGLFRGLSSDILDKRRRVKPNQGIRRSARNSVFIGLISGLVSWLICTLSYTLGYVFIYGLGPALGVGQSVGRSIGLLVGLSVGLLCGLLNGGLACIEHYVLRLLLWQEGCINWNIPYFLDYAAERILLRQVGGGYIFIHRLLLEYFASLDTGSASSEEVTQTPDVPSVSW